MKFAQTIAGSPAARFSVSLLSTIVLGVLGNVYASQIMPSTGFTYGLLVTVPSFWILLPLTVIWLYFNYAFFQYDGDLALFKDDAHCLAFVRKMKLDALAATLKKDPSKANLTDMNSILEELRVKKP